MQTTVSISFTYTKASLYAVSKMQFSLVHFKFKLLYQLVCGCLILIGVLSPLHEGLRMVMMMIGCLALPSLYLPVRLATEKVSAYYGSNLPQVTYRFTKHNFTRIVDGKGGFLGYNTVVRLIEDATYFYIVDKDVNVFLVEINQIGNHREIQMFKDLLEKATNLKWGRLGSGWELSIYKLFKK